MVDNARSDDGDLGDVLGDVVFGAAQSTDLGAIVAMLTDDVLGSDRESPDIERYETAFAEISADPHHTLVVGRTSARVVSTLQLTVLPCLTHGATKRAQIEGVRVDRSARGHGVGEAMCRWAIERAAAQGCGIIQLTTDHRRADALRFYERLGFVATHHGMKLPL